VGAGAGQAESAGGGTVLLVRKYPDTLEQLEKVAAG